MPVNKAKGVSIVVDGVVVCSIAEGAIKLTGKLHTDRELLELAAKAAGLRIDKSPTNGGGLKNDGFDLNGNAVLDWHNGITWNPLKSDADAFRLAVTLRIRHDRHPRIPFVAAFAPFTIERFEEPEGDDLYAATRRAIVRAAAAMGMMIT